MVDSYEATIQVPPRVESITAVQKFFGALSDSMNCPAKIRTDVELGIEEGLVSLFKNAGSAGGREKIIVDLEFRTDAIRIVAKAAGRPFDSRKLPTRNEPLRSLDEDDLGLGNFLLQEVMDSVQWRYVEKEGQELEMIKGLPATIKPARELQPLDESGEQHRIVGTISLRTVQSLDDALALTICAYDIYRYAYKDVIYYPQELLARISSGKMQCWIAVDEAGTIFGHYALMKKNAEDMIAEMGAAFVRPECRKDGLFRQLCEVAHTEIFRSDLRGLYSLSVTNHTSTQMTSERVGRRSVGLRLASTPAIFVEGAAPGDRITSVLNYCQLVKRTPRAVYVPAPYREIIFDAYALLGIPVVEGGETGNETFDNGYVECKRDQTWNRALVDARGTGASCHKLRAVTELLVESGIAHILLSIDLEDPGAPQLAAEAGALGYVYSGLFPESMESGKDALQLQYLNGIKVDPSRILLYQESAKMIMDFIKSEAPQVFV
jgi:anti-sigma regulatory factor (Ser/Thr protein kinase)